MSELQLKIIASRVYAYLKAKKKREESKSYDSKLQASEDIALLNLSDMLAIYLDKPIKPAEDFDKLNIGADDKTFMNSVRKVIEKYSKETKTMVSEKQVQSFKMKAREVMKTYNEVLHFQIEGMMSVPFQKAYAAMLAAESEAEKAFTEITGKPNRINYIVENQDHFLSEDWCREILNS